MESGLEEKNVTLRTAGTGGSDVNDFPEPIGGCKGGGEAFEMLYGMADTEIIKYI